MIWGWTNSNNYHVLVNQPFITNTSPYVMNTLFSQASERPTGTAQRPPLPHTVRTPFLSVHPSSSQGPRSKSAPTYPSIQLSDWALKPSSTPKSHAHNETGKERSSWMMEPNHNLLVLNCGWSKTCCIWPECDFARLVCLLDAWPISLQSGRLCGRQL